MFFNVSFYFGGLLLKRGDYVFNINVLHPGVPAYTMKLFKTSSFPEHSKSISFGKENIVKLLLEHGNSIKLIGRLPNSW